MPHAATIAAILVVTLLAAVPPLSVWVPSAQAATTFTVTFTGTGGDATPDGVCDADPGVAVLCSLREAIQEANANPGADAIVFNIALPGVQTIRGNEQLPPITETVSIDGYTQPGASPNTAAVGTNAVLLIELDGINSGGFDSGLRLQPGASNSLIRGLVIISHRTGIEVSRDAAGVRIVGCFIGTTATGTTICGNLTGIFTGTNTTVGGSTLAARNLISGNVNGVQLGGNGSVVQGKLIGPDKTGASGFGNDYGVMAFGAGLIGGALASTANTIAFNRQDGVVVLGNATNTGNRILCNAIFANGGLGIDLNDDGPAANDPRDRDTGPNRLQNTPRLDQVVTGSALTRITGRLASTPGQDFVLRFFANRAGENEGRTFVGQQAVLSNAQGFVPFSFVPKQRVSVGNTVTATATDAGGNTSEFSPPRTVEPLGIGG